MRVRYNTLMETHNTQDPLYSSELAQARKQFDAFVTDLNPSHPVTILCDGDVDGLGAGVTLHEHLVQRGISAEKLAVLHPAKGENAFTPSTRGYVIRTHPRALFVLDLGISERRIIHTIPTLFVDHHHPTGQPPDAVTLTGYNWDPIPTSSLLTYLLCNSDAATPSDIAWKASIGNMGDLGPEHPILTQAAKAQKLKWIREATTILNAGKRSRLYPQAEAFRALLAAPSAQQIAEGDTPALTLLKTCRAEVKEALNEAKKLAPKFSKKEQVALLEFSDPNRIHPLLAQSWHGRLPKFVVFAANHGWLPGKVAFSARTSSSANILELLQKYRHVIPDELEYGYGHDQAAGGVISEEGWEKLKGAMALP